MNHKQKPKPRDQASPFRVVIAGCGGMAQAWVDYTLARKDAKIVGLVDLDLSQAEKLSRQFSLTDVIQDTSLEKVIRNTQADLVYVLASPAAHHPLAQTALSLGCDVFTEKPLAASMAQATELIALAEKNGCAFSVMQNRRYLKQIRSYRDLVQQQIGRPGFMAADFFLGPQFGGFRDLMDSPLLLDMAIHTFDAARLIGQGNAVSVYCHEFNPEGSWYRGNACATAIFEMTNGLVFDYRGSWCAQGSQTSWEGSWRVAGSEGSAIWDGHNMPYAERLPQASQPAEIENRWHRQEGQADWLGREGHPGCLDAMFSALIAGRPAETAAQDNLHSLAMVEAAIESARRGEKVRID